jgi:putative hydrolase of the HAD superfamily
MPNDIQAFLFDLDDTLYSRNAAFRSWIQTFARNELGLAEDDPRYQETVERIITLDAWGYTSRTTVFSAIKEARTPPLEESIEQLIETYQRRFSEYMHPEPGTQRLITTIQNASIPFGIVTNGATTRQFSKIQALGLDKLTTCIFISKQFGYEKPAATIFLAAANCLGHKPQNILFVGDNPYKDIWGAQQVGMQTAWLHHDRAWPTDQSETQPDYTISDLGELCSLLAIAEA